MPSLLDNFFGSLQSPGAAMAAGLLTPTPNASFGGGLLQGQQAARQQVFADNRNMLAMSIEAARQQEMAQLEEQARRQQMETQALLSYGVQGGMNRSLSEVLAYGTNPSASLMQYMNAMKPPASTNIYNQMPAHKEYLQELGKGGAKALNESKDKAENFRNQLETSQRSYELVNQGIISGQFANARLGLAKIARLAGFKGNDVEATEAYIANQSKNTLAILGTGDLGAGTGLSDADREYAANIVAGNIKLDESSMRRILYINAKAAELAIKRHNEKIDTAIADSQSQGGSQAPAWLLESMKVQPVTFTGTPDGSPPVGARQQGSDGNWYIKTGPTANDWEAE